MADTYGDWQKVVKDFFGDKTKNMTIVELGKGEGTRFLVDNFAKVYSVEYSRYPFVASWEAAGLPNHKLENVLPIPNLATFDDILIRTSGQQRPPELMPEAKRLHDAALQHTADILFIDHGCHNRGEVLELAKQASWRYIVIHDINFPFYGYNFTCPGFSLYHDLVGQGTAIFIRQPRLTVVIPSVGRPTVWRSVQSLVGQDNPNWLAQVGFDAVPEDKIPAVLADPRVTYTKFPTKLGGGSNHGGEVRNKLIAQCTTEWVCFLDDDDTFRPDYVTKFLAESAGADAIVFRMASGNPANAVLPPEGTTRPVINYVGISFAAKKSFLAAHNIQFKTIGGEDYYFLADIEKAGGKILFSKNICYNVNC
jgi:hypothetical protein